MTAATPTALKLLMGNPGKRAINKNEPKPAKMRVTPPSYLSVFAKSRFKYHAELLAKVNVSTSLDVSALAKLCEAEEEYQELSKTIEQHGYMQETTNMNGDAIIKPNPAVAARADAWRRVKMMYEQFGMTPSARSKLTVEEIAEKDPLEKYGV